MIANGGHRYYQSTFCNERDLIAVKWGFFAIVAAMYYIWLAETDMLHLKQKSISG